MGMLPDDLHNCVLVAAGDLIFVERFTEEEREYWTEWGRVITDPFGSHSKADTLEWLDLLELSRDVDNPLHVSLWIMRKAGAHLAKDKRFGMKLYATYGEPHGWFDSKEKWDAVTKILLAPKRDLLMKLLLKVKEKKENRENEFR